MVWLLLGVTGLLALLVLALAVVVLRLSRAVRGLQHSSSSDLDSWPEPSGIHDSATLDEKPAAPEFVITRMGDAEVEPVVAVPTVPATVFADIVAREAVVQAASLAAGLRRALDPETRNRIRFHMRQEVRRSRKQRKLELREVRREWAARQREAGAA